ncbi:unnamed protein product, partial [Brassica oleracea var. botrytis]
IFGGLKVIFSRFVFILLKTNRLFVRSILLSFWCLFSLRSFQSSFSDQILCQIFQVIFRGHKSSSGSLVRSIYSLPW